MTRNSSRWSTDACGRLTDHVNIMELFLSAFHLHNLACLVYCVWVFKTRFRSTKNVSSNLCVIKCTSILPACIYKPRPAPAATWTGEGGPGTRGWDWCHGSSNWDDKLVNDADSVQMVIATFAAAEQNCMAGCNDVVDNAIEKLPSSSWPCQAWNHRGPYNTQNFQYDD